MSERPASADNVLCVDLDGTLLRTDMILESALLLLKQSPRHILSLPGWLLQGRAVLKDRVAEHIEFDAASLPYRQELLDLLKAERSRGRTVVLATASDIRIARKIADHLGVFDSVIASDGKVSLSGERKLQALRTLLGEKKFDYVGDSWADVPVWRGAEHAWVVEPSPALLKRAREATSVTKVFDKKPASWPQALRPLRPYQWAKNLLLFAPVIAAHRLSDAATLWSAAAAFASFSLCASSAYVLNDLLDLEHDRRHATKRKRPFASGDLPIGYGVFLAPALLALSALIALGLPAAFAEVLGGYYLATMAYSLFLKKLALTDVFVLAGLYTIRLFAGSVATGIPISNWFLAFAMFLFLSLAFAKRYAELRDMDPKDTQRVPGRGYWATDVDTLVGLGTSSGYISALVLALYVNSPEIVRFYAHPQFLWLLCPLELYWISRIWLKAHRGQLHQDPLLFALKDAASYLLAAAAAIVVLAGSR